MILCLSAGWMDLAMYGVVVAFAAHCCPMLLVKHQLCTVLADVVHAFADCGGCISLQLLGT
jgi:hypothetical protein